MHCIELRFSDQILSGSLHCPDSGCDTNCPNCNADLTVAEAERCDICEEVNPGECWLESWVGSVPIEELLKGEIEFPIEATVEGAWPVLRIVADA